MVDVADNSVALVVTSPPYFAGKAYEESLGENGVPADYFEYLAMLERVFAECARVLEPGGRIAVNVANLGRRPYRSLAGDVTQILQDLGLLLRGEVVWWKGRAAGGSCAWGTLPAPVNPVLRDVTERIVIASKGRFDRALKPRRGPSSTLRAVDRHDRQGRVPRGHHRPVGDGARERHPGRSSGAVPGRAARAPDQALHLSRATSCSTRSWARAPPRSPPCAPTATTSATTPTPTTWPGPSARIAAEQARRLETQTEELSLFRVEIPAVKVGRVRRARGGRLPVAGGARGAPGQGDRRRPAQGLRLHRDPTDVKYPCGVEVNFVARTPTATTGPSTCPARSPPTGPGSSAPTPSGRRWARRRSSTSTPTFELPLVLLTTDAPTRGSAGAKALGIATGTAEASPSPT